jgi:hypothetical protein
MRVWNYTSGITEAEWYLPGTSFQWSGISLERGADATYIYLTQSIPGSVWKFHWSQVGNAKGAFPSCAKVYEGDLIEKIVGSNGEKFRRSKMRYVEGY